jgi:hypothetical protein
MAGYTGFSIGVVRDTVVFIPISVILKTGGRRISPYDREWQRLLASTGQREMLTPEAKVDVDAKVSVLTEKKKKIRENILEEAVDIAMKFNKS